MRVNKKVIVIVLLLLVISLVFVEMASAKRRSRKPTVSCICQNVAPSGCCDRNNNGFCYNVTENKYDVSHNQLRAGRCVAFKTCRLYLSGTDVGPC